MSYQSTKPLSNDALNISQGDLQGNFIELNAAFDVNHVGFNVSDQGKHDFIHFPSQTPSGTFPPVTSATEVGLYAKAGDLYFRPKNQTIAVSTNDINLTDITGNVTSGYYKLPNGLIMKWGQGTILSTSSTQPVVFPTTFPFTTLFNIQLTASNTPSGSVQDGIIAAESGTTTGFSVTRSSLNGSQIGFYWFALGV
jgi:hypothetical protein